jgi:hypothetical protein
MTMFGKSLNKGKGRDQLGVRQDCLPTEGKGNVQQMDLERVEHTLPRDDDLLGLLLDGQRSDERGDFLGGLPLGELTETLLTGPDGGVDDLEEELTCSGVEDEDRSVDRLGRQVSFERLVDGDSVDVGVVDEPDDLVREKLRVVLRVEVRLGRLGRVELETLADSLSEDVKSRLESEKKEDHRVRNESLSSRMKKRNRRTHVGLHNLAHGLLDERLHSREPVSVRGVQVVSEIDGDEDSGGRRVDRHRVRGVVKELGSGVSL